MRASDLSSILSGSGIPGPSRRPHKQESQLLNWLIKQACVGLLPLGSSHIPIRSPTLCKHASPEDDELMRCLFLGIHSGHAYLMRGTRPHTFRMQPPRALRRKGTLFKGSLKRTREPETELRTLVYRFCVSFSGWFLATFFRFDTTTDANT